MARRHGSSKRSTSATEISVAKHEDGSSQIDGACFGKPDAPETVQPEPAIEMPSFLKLTPEGVLLRY